MARSLAHYNLRLPGGIGDSKFPISSCIELYSLPLYHDFRKHFGENGDNRLHRTISPFSAEFLFFIKTAFS